MQNESSSSQRNAFGTSQSNRGQPCMVIFASILDLLHRAFIFSFKTYADFCNIFDFLLAKNIGITAVVKL